MENHPFYEGESVVYDGFKCMARKGLSCVAFWASYSLSEGEGVKKLLVTSEENDKCDAPIDHASFKKFDFASC